MGSATVGLIGSSSSLHSEACNALGASDGVVHSSISQEVVSLRATANSREWVGRAGSPHFCAEACTLAATRLMLSVCSHGPTHGRLMLACCRCAAACGPTCPAGGTHVISHRARRQAAWGICRGGPSWRSPSDGQPNRACVFMFVGRLWTHSV